MTNSTPVLSKPVERIRYIAMKPRHDVGVTTFPRMRWTVLEYKTKKDAIRASELPTNKEMIILHIPTHLQEFFYQIYYKDSNL